MLKIIITSICIFFFGSLISQEIIAKYKYKPKGESKEIKKCSIYIYSDSTFMVEGKTDKTTLKRNKQKGVKTRGFFLLNGNYKKENNTYVFYQNGNVKNISISSSTTILMDGLTFFCKKCLE